MKNNDSSLAAIFWPFASSVIDRKIAKLFTVFLTFARRSQPRRR